MPQIPAPMKTILASFTMRLPPGRRPRGEQSSGRLPYSRHAHQRGTVNPRGPTYSDCGRMRRSSACCSITCAHQPAHLPQANRATNVRRGQADRLQHERRVELDVRLEVASRLHLVEHAHHRLLDLAREVEERAIVQRGAGHLRGDLAQHVRPRIAHLVDAVAESHDAAAGRELIAAPNPRRSLRCGSPSACRAPGPALRHAAAP